MGQHLLVTHPIRAGQGRRSAVCLKKIPNVIVPMLWDIPPSRNTVGIHIKNTVANLPQLVMTQPGLFLHLAFCRGQCRRIAFLAMPAWLKPTGQLLMPDEEGEHAGWVDDEGRSGDVALERVPAEGRRLGADKRRNLGQMVCFGVIGGRVGSKRLE